MSQDLDILVIGAGACGLAAAIAGHDVGASVAIVEKRDRPGGNSALSTGSVPAANSRFQREAGIEDAPERLVRDLMGIAKETDDLDLVKRLASVSAETVEWLVDTVGARLRLVTAYRHIGHSVPRLHAPASRRGQDLVDDMVAAAEARDIPIAVGNGVAELIVADGAVQGAVVEVDGVRSTIRAGKTILAVNGFAGNPDLVRRFCPEIAGAEYFGARGSTGEAVLWGEQLGAAFANMSAYQGYAAIAYPQGSLLSWTTIEKGGIIVGDDARRFGDESLGYSGYARIVLSRGGTIFAVFDQKIFDIASAEEEFMELWAGGGVKKGETVAEIARLAGLDPAVLEAEIAAYNAAAAVSPSPLWGGPSRREAPSGVGVGQEAPPALHPAPPPSWLGLPAESVPPHKGKGKVPPDRYGRQDFGLAPLVAPFYIGRVVPGLFHTQGGLKVDGDGRVMRPDGRPVPNLFAGGGAAAGISGRAGALGYASGNGLLSAIALGRLAALAAATELDRTP